MISLTVVFRRVTPAQLYTAWLSGRQHAAMTGAAATGSTKVGGKFTAWDGYIWGQNKKLIQDKQIVQSWRTSEFADTDADSTLTLTFTKVKTGTKLQLKHVGTPKNQEDNYRSGWDESYFQPMADYFAAHG